ncbi:hypothetical protein Fleli_2233 [Bernardetia litoralis DSM 6794]|uniref:RHS repeat-associated core domain protein n=1 Tax=Bernardetia litoralis (strain ATCC 23117 / DSM 6794 / NBRC 15988 / NCIMB 1366 / Fx l1 / Sio-4) TaxID=880071 RepID=I4AKX5_BERLS|nr:hypothetical protein [Bernardetia litoralis]AFM04610.1 hypothetical protein Fleli_2233 [Bernardetia litoralis DSM 6794]
MNYKILIFALLFGGIFLCGCSSKESKNKTTSNLEFGKENTQFRNTETKNLSPYAMFGDSSFVLMTEQERNPINYLVIEQNSNESFISKIIFEFKTATVFFIDKKGELAHTLTLNDTDIAKFLSEDPAANEYPAISPYAFVANNPLSFVDPDGRRIKFAKNMTATDKRELVKDLNMKSSGYKFYMKGRKLKYREVDADKQKYGQYGDIKRSKLLPEILTKIIDAKGVVKIIREEGLNPHVDPGTNNIYWDGNVITQYKDVASDALKEDNYSWTTFGHAMNFIHEILHSQIGSKLFPQYDLDGDGTLTDNTTKMFDLGELGEVTPIVNSIRTELNLPLRSQYAAEGHNSYEVVGNQKMSVYVPVGYVFFDQDLLENYKNPDSYPDKTYPEYKYNTQTEKYFQTKNKWNPPSDHTHKKGK